MHQGINRANEHTRCFAADARREATTWVREIAAISPGYVGAFLAGSVAALPEGAELPPWSDTDVMVVLNGASAQKPGKFRRNGVLLEGTLLERADLEDPEQVLRGYHLANAVANAVILDDPSGFLGMVHASVSKAFPERQWVEARVADALGAVRRGVTGEPNEESLALAGQSWVFPTGIATHVLLVAGLRNPTVRRRYETCRDLLAAHGRLDVHETLLALLGSREWDQTVAQRHLDALIDLYDAASGVDAPTYRFASDVTALSRPISIEGTQDMIDRGFHREAAFWLVVTGSRALQKLAHAGAEALAETCEPAFSSLLADLGVASPGERSARRAAVRDSLATLATVASEMTAATPGMSPA